MNWHHKTAFHCRLVVSIGVLTAVLFGVLPQARGIALFAREDITLLGNNIGTDSFDSADMAHSTNGGFDPAKALGHGDVAGNGYVEIANANIRGSLFIGPDGVWSIAPNGYATGGVFRPPMLPTIYDVTVPFTNGLAPLTDVLIGGTNYAYALVGGNYEISSLQLSSGQTLYVGTPASLFVRGNCNMASDATIYIAPGGSLKLYVGGGTTVLRKIVHSGSALTFAYYGLTSNTNVLLSTSTNTFTGVVLAPNASLSAITSISTDFEASLWTKQINMTSRPRVYYDENLSRYEVLPPFITQHPINQTATAHANISFSAVAQHVLDGHYQWQFNGADISGANSKTLTISNAVASDAGNYSVIVSNAFGFMQSSSAVLAIIPDNSSKLVVTGSGDGFEFEMSGLVGATYAIESSTNLADWERISTNTAPFTYSDTNLDAFPQRFYRAVYLP